MESSTHGADQRKSCSWTDRIWVVAGVALLLFQIGLPSLGNDEAAYAYRVGLTWEHMWEVLAQDNYPPLYFVLLKNYVSAAGLSEVALRLTSVPFAVLSWLVFIPFVRRHLPSLTAELAIPLVVFSPLLLFLGRIAKYYSLMGFLTIASVVLLWKILEDNRQRPLRSCWGWIALWGISSLALIYIHYMGAVVWWAMGLWLVYTGVCWRDGRAWRLFGLLCVFFLAYLPQLPHILHRTVGSEDAAEVVLADSSVLRRLVAQGGYTAYSFAVGHTLEPGHLLMAGLACAVAGGVFLAGLWYIFKRRHSNETPDRVLRFLLFQSVVMMAGGFLIIVVFLPGLPVLAVSERLAFALPFLITIAAAGAASIPFRARMVLFIVYGAALFWSLSNMLTNRENVQWEYLIPWNKIEERVRQDSRRPVAVAVDSWHMGSRGWYYLRDEQDKFVSLREVYAQDAIEETARELAEEFPVVYYVRSIRDTSPEGHVTTFAETLKSSGMEECRTWRYVEDSPSMKRLKKLFRRGSGVKTYSHKVEMGRYCRL